MRAWLKQHFELFECCLLNAFLFASETVSKHSIETGGFDKRVYVTVWQLKLRPKSVFQFKFNIKFVRRCSRERTGAPYRYESR